MTKRLIYNAFYACGNRNLFPIDQHEQEIPESNGDMEEIISSILKLKGYKILLRG